MNIPNITTTRNWTAEDVREVCIKNNLYTAEKSAEYTHMLDLVEKLPPTTENLYIVASDINDHSKKQTITNIMYLLENQAVKTFFDVES